MVFFTANTFKRSGDGESANWNNYNERQIVIDEQFQDPFGNITSEEYFKKSRDNINLALSQGVSDAKRTTLLKESSQLNEDQNNFSFTNSPILGNGIEELKADIQDTWKNIWSNKDLLSTGNFAVMTQGMESYLGEQREEAIQFRDQVAELTDDPNMLNQIDSVIELYEDNENFYRGVSINPEEYRIDINSNSRGQISDIALKNVNDAPGGFFDTNQKDQSGLSIYSKPHKAYEQEDGTQGFAIGNASFEGDSAGGFFAKDDNPIDFASVVIEDPLNAAPGTLIKSPDGQMYGKNPDGTYFKFSDTDVKNFGFDENNVIAASRKNIDDINRNFEVIDANDEFIRRKQVRESIQAQLDESLKNDPGRLSPLEQVTIEPIRSEFRKFREGVSESKKHVSPAGRRVKGAIESAQIAVGQAANIVIEKAGSLFNRARGFFKSITEAPDTKIK